MAVWQPCNLGLFDVVQKSGISLLEREGIGPHVDSWSADGLRSVIRNESGKSFISCISTSESHSSKASCLKAS